MLPTETIEIKQSVKRSRFSENNSHVHWLKEGANYFGKNPLSDIVFPGEEVGFYSGILFLNKGRVLLRVAAGQKILNKKKQVDNIFIFENDSSLILEYCSYKFQIIGEQGRYGLLIFR